MMNHTNRAAAVNAVISTRIMALVGTGMAPIEACKAILGAEKVDAMISDLYDALRAKAGR